MESTLPPISGLPAQDATPVVLSTTVSCTVEEGGFLLHTPEAELPNTGPNIPVKEKQADLSKTPAHTYISPLVQGLQPWNSDAYIQDESSYLRIT